MTKTIAALRSWLLPLLLLALFLALRLPSLGRFVTTDEALWLRRSANFFLAINQGDWAATAQSPHPGVVTMWAGALGYEAAFPDYAHVGSPEIHDEQLLQLMENRGINPMTVLAAGRFALLLVHAAVFLTAWPFARRLLGPAAAALGLALLALDPFTIAHQRLLHLDGLLASFMLLSVLAYVDFLQHRKLSSLVVSAVAAGLALLTKTPAWFMLPAIFAFTGIHLYRHWLRTSRSMTTSKPPSPWKEPALSGAKGEGKALRSNAGMGSGTAPGLSLWAAPFLWLALALLILFVAYPAMWGAPFDTLANMFGYALGSAEGEFSGPVFFNGAVYPEGDLGAAGWLFYPLSFLWRSTPLTLIGLVLAGWYSFRQVTISWGNKSINRLIDRSTTRPIDPLTKRPIDLSTSRPLDLPTSLFLFSLAFLLFMTIAGKKFDRYLLPAIPPLILLAGWGWARLLESVRWLQQKSWRPVAALGMLAAAQLAFALPTAPYFLSYYNPLLGGASATEQSMMIGWGEGLDQAAVYLNSQSLQPGEAAAWYSVSFNLMTSAAATDIPIKLELSRAELDALLAKEYLVIYIHQWQRGTPQNLLNALAPLQPEYTVTINGLEYVRVYRLH